MSSGVTTPGSLTSPGSSATRPLSSTGISPISTSRASSTPPISSTTAVSSTTQQSSTSAISTTSPASSIPVSTTAQSSSLPSSTSTTTYVTTPSSTSSLSSTTSEASSTTLQGSTSIAVSSGPNTIYSTTIVYVSGTDGRGSRYTSATAIGGGSGSRGGGPGNDTNIGAIVGGVVGVGGAALLGVLAFCFWRKRKRNDRDALDEKMFDPGRNFHSSSQNPAPIDLLSDHPRGNQISPYPAGFSSTNGYEGYNAGAAGIGAGAAAGAYHSSSDRYDRPTGGSADSSAYGTGTGSDAYLMHGGSQGYSSSHGHGGGGGQDYLPGVADHRLSGGWGVAAAGMGSPTQAGFGNGDGNGYTARDYANYSQNGPRAVQGSGGPYAAMMGAGAGAGAAAGGAYASDPRRTSYEEQEQDGYRPRMSATAMAKLREARGEDVRGSHSNRGSASGGHARRPSSNTNSQAYGGFSDENYGVGPELDRRRSSAGLSGSGDGESSHDVYGHGRRSSNGGGLVVHNDGGPVEDDGEEEGAGLPSEIPPAYDSVPSGGNGRGQAL